MTCFNKNVNIHVHVCTYSHAYWLRWAKYGIHNTTKGLAEMKRIFDGWQCLVLCSGAAYDWQAELVAREVCSPQMLQLGVGLVDVYCISPWALQLHGDGMGDAGGDALVQLHASWTRSHHRLHNNNNNTR